MIRINQIKVPIDTNRNKLNEILLKKAALKLNVPKEIIHFEGIYKKSLDARKAGELKYIYSINVSVPDETKIKSKDNDVLFVKDDHYTFDYTAPDEFNRPIIIGMGPAGLFCGLLLAKAGFKPIIFERGKKVNERKSDVEKFWEEGILDPDSNVQFGEGGAGTFSDGKLNTLVKDRFGRNRFVLETFVEYGAHEDILYESKPHIGTDVLIDVVASMRKAIFEYGGEIHFESCVTELLIEDSKVKGVIANNKEFLSNNIVLAIGHSARDTFSMLYNKNVPMEAKSFAVGFRVSHPQDVIDLSQYKEGYEAFDLPPAAYKLAYNSDTKRGVYSFCMCPGGYVVNASSENGMTAVNGMSYKARDSKVANSAIIVSVTPKDFGDNSPLGGVEYQRQIEKKAYELGKGKIPVQKYGDYKSKVMPTAAHECNIQIAKAFKGDIEYSDLTKIFSSEINEDFVRGMEYFGNKIKHFNDDNALLAGVESRTSSPVRIHRDENGLSKIDGLFPCGEGAGYAGGITSAAMDGIFIAQCVAQKIITEDK